jgi:metallo-beta-lactamase family protein
LVRPHVLKSTYNAANHGTVRHQILLAEFCNLRLHFMGANRQVTGSRYCLEAGGKELVIDYGLFQERPFEQRNWDPCLIPPNEVEAVCLTHIHIDHSGLLPRFIKQGFEGPIYATQPTCEFAPIVLADAARIQAEDAEYKRKRHQKEGRLQKMRIPEPLYSDADAMKTVQLMRGVGYGKPIDIHGAFRVTYHDAGHILGSAMLEIDVIEGASTRKVIFSGDLGQNDKPLIRDPSLLKAADYVVMESTYGDRNHKEAGPVVDQLAEIINKTVRRGGQVVIPTFAIERAQELMYYLSQLVHEDRIPDVPIFLDSPMAVDVTGVYTKFPDYLDADAMKMLRDGKSPLKFAGLKLSSSVQESKEINQRRGPAIIMATSGMCDAGRIKHHLKHTLERPDCTILFVGHQGSGTLGRIILDGARKVRIHGGEYVVRAEKAQIYGFSGHADRDDLIRWISHFDGSPKRVFLTHGEEEPARSLGQYIETELKLPVTIPNYRETVDLG